MPEQLEAIYGEVSNREAAELLNRAWPRPAMEYSEAYIDWQMNFPGAGRIMGIRSGGALVAMGADTPRRMSLGTEVLQVRIVSFIAVDPAWRGQGLAEEVYRGLLEGIQEPVLTFAMEASAGQRLIEKMYPKMGFQLQRVASCPVMGKLPQGAQSEWEVKERELGLWVEAGAKDVLMAAPNEVEQEHWMRDPRRCCLMRLKNRRTGEEAAAAVAVSRVLQASGEVTESVTVEWVAAEHGALEGLGALADWAAHWYGKPGAVKAANLSCWSREELRLQGWRQISGGFSVWVAAPKGLGLPVISAALGAVT